VTRTIQERAVLGYNLAFSAGAARILGVRVSALREQLRASARRSRR
jgi:hypothetical protein